MDLEEVVIAGETALLRPSLLRVLVDRGVASEDELRLAHAEGMGAGERLGEVVLRRGWLDEVGLAQALAEQWGVPYAESNPVLDKEGLLLLDPRKAGELGACPVEGAAGRLTVAVAEPTEERVASVRVATGCDPLLVVVTPATLERLHDEADAADHENEDGRTLSAAAVEGAGEDDADGLAQVEVALAAATRQVAAVRDHVSRLLSANAAAEHDHHRLQTEVETTREALAALERERQADRDAALQAKAAVEAALSERDARQAALEATCGTLQNQLRSLRSLVDQMNRILD